VSSVVDLPGTEDHAHARMVLGHALASGSFSHAYLFHGPPGSGKRTATRALAAELLASGEVDSDAARRRVAAGTHPDLTWVKPSGAHVMRVSDIDEPVVAAATRTPFESSRRVFVLERVDTMNDEVANRLLKTLEEPPPFVHLILLTDALQQVIETVVSRCQLVRFDPLPAERIAGLLSGAGIDAATATACARVALGNSERARFLASSEGAALRENVERLVVAALDGERRSVTVEPWRALLERAEERRGVSETAVRHACAERLEQEPPGRERKALEREFDEAARRDGRRARTEVLDLGLELAALLFRDVLCAAEGADEAILATDRAGELAGHARGRDERRLRAAIEQCEAARLALELNVNEELLLTALTLRLARLVGAVA
jgi:DNA polymerase III subunit delta'